MPPGPPEIVQFLIHPHLAETTPPTDVARRNMKMGIQKMNFYGSILILTNAIQLSGSRHSRQNQLRCRGTFASAKIEGVLQRTCIFSRSRLTLHKHL